LAVNGGAKSQIIARLQISSIPIEPSSPPTPSPEDRYYRTHTPVVPSCSPDQIGLQSQSSILAYIDGVSSPRCHSPSANGSRANSSSSAGISRVCPRPSASASAPAPRYPLAASKWEGDAATASAPRRERVTHVQNNHTQHEPQRYPTSLPAAALMAERMRCNIAAEPPALLSECAEERQCRRRSRNLP
jgi:hypothetical protein